MIKAILLDLESIFRTYDPSILGGYWINELSSHLLKKGLPSESAETYLKAHKALFTADRRVDLTNYQFLTEFLATEFPEIDPKRVITETEVYFSSRQPDPDNCLESYKVETNSIRRLIESDFAIVLATNPVVTKTTVQRQLAWIGLSIDFDDYAFVAHAENMHFPKSDLAYFAEIIARVGVEPDEALYCVTDRTTNTLSARAIGLHAFRISWVNDLLPATHSHVKSLMDSKSWGQPTHISELSPGMIEPQLRGNLGALFGILSQVEEHHWHQHPEKDEWSVHQVMCHLLESESNVQRPRLEKILTEENPFITPPPPPAGPDSLECAGHGMEIAHNFVLERQKTLNLLRNLNPSDWNRPARHSLFGPTTLLEMAHFTAQHDRLHLTQLCQTLGKCE